MTYLDPAAYKQIRDTLSRAQDFLRPINAPNLEREVEKSLALMPEQPPRIQDEKMDETVKAKGRAIGMIAGPAEVLEAIRLLVMRKSGIPVDWGYVAGRGVFQAVGTPEELQKARRELQSCFPQCMIYTEDGQLTSDLV